MLYLAEVKRQSRGFIGGSKIELKLLACQHNDQSWSAIPTEDIITWEDSQMSVGEGALLLVNLAGNRQIQGNPEFAGSELVRQLQKISRLMEKSKEEQEKIEQWKQSLTYQSQELTRREMEIESRLEQIEQIEEEFEYLERQRREIEEARDSLKKEQQVLQETKNEFGSLPVDLKSEYANKIQILIQRLVSAGDSHYSPWQQLNFVLETIQQQQAQFNNYWHQLEEKQTAVAQRQEEVNQKQATIESYKREIEATQNSLEDAKTQLQVQQTILVNKQWLLGRINLDLQKIESLQDTLNRMATGGEQGTENKVNQELLENMPLGELEATVSQLQHDLDKLVRFVNEQEEELTLQFETVKELQAKLNSASEFESSSIEEELKYEQERKKMLDQTLIGQRRTLWDKQDFLLQHLRILRRRQGTLEPEQYKFEVNFTPLLHQLEEQQSSMQHQRQQLEAEIEHLQQSLEEIQEMVNQKIAQQEQEVKELENQEREYQQAKIELAKLESELEFYEPLLQPIKDNLTRASQSLQEVSQWFGAS